MNQAVQQTPEPNGADDPESGPARWLRHRRRSVWHKLAITARHMRRHFDERVAELGVTGSQWTLISVVAQRPGATQRVLAQVLEISEASAGRLVDRLCADGLVERRAKDDDRRAYCVHLTDSGEALLARLTDLAAAHEEVAFAGMSQAEVAGIDDVLERILVNLGKHAPAAEQA